MFDQVISKLYLSLLAPIVWILANILAFVIAFGIAKFRAMYKEY